MANQPVEEEIYFVGLGRELQELSVLHLNLMSPATSLIASCVPVSAFAVGPISS